MFNLYVILFLPPIGSPPQGVSMVSLAFFFRFKLCFLGVLQDYIPEY